MLLFVTPGNRLADVGTDHGYIPIALCLEGVIPSALAMDVNPGPLERAKEHIQQFDLETDIHTRLSDGVQALCPGEADSVLIAGMGGALTVKILEAGEKVLASVKELILQPQSEIDKVRSYLLTHGYVIVGEKMVYEDGKYYPAMRAVHGEMPLWQEVELQYGKIICWKEKTSGIRGISERQTENLQENTGKTSNRRKESRKDHRTAKRAGGRTSADRAGTGGV